MISTPLTIVQTYYREVWSKHDVERIPQLCADPVVRHDPKGLVTLSHQEQRERILSHAGKQLRFHIVSGHCDETFATIIWQATSAISDYRVAGIEVLKIVDGRIAEVWNATRDTLWE